MIISWSRALGSVAVVIAISVNGLPQCSSSFHFVRHTDTMLFNQIGDWLAPSRLALSVSYVLMDHPAQRISKGQQPSNLHIQECIEHNPNQTDGCIIDYLPSYIVPGQHPPLHAYGSSIDGQNIIISNAILLYTIVCPFLWLSNYQPLSKLHVLLNMHMSPVTGAMLLYCYSGS